MLDKYTHIHVSAWQLGLMKGHVCAKEDLLKHSESFEWVSGVSINAGERVRISDTNSQMELGALAIVLFPAFS